MRFNDRARDCKSDPHTCFLCSHKSIKDSFRILDSRAVVYHLNQQLVRLGLCSSNLDIGENLPSFRRVDCIRNQVDENLLNLDKVNKDVGKIFIEEPVNCNIKFLGVSWTKRTAPFTISHTITSVLSKGSCLKSARMCCMTS